VLDGKHGRESIEVQGPIVVDEMAYAHALALRGIGIALLPSTLARSSVVRGELVHILPALQQKGGAVYLVHPTTRSLPRRVALLRDHLVETLRPLFANC
jgi:DNA-binding transcriptional LysR family regulator